MLESRAVHAPSSIELLRGLGRRETDLVLEAANAAGFTSENAEIADSEFLKRRCDMKRLAGNFTVLLVITVSLAPPAFDQQKPNIQGQVLGGGAPIANSKVTLYAATAGEPKQLAQTKTDNEGRFEVRATGTPADSNLYLLAFGGEPKVRDGGDNPAIALLAVLGSKPPAHVVINEMTTVASVWTNAQFLVGATLKGPPLGLRIAAGNVPNFVNLSTGGWGEAIQSPLNSSQTPTMANFATLADLISACVTRVVVASQRLRG